MAKLFNYLFPGSEHGTSRGTLARVLRTLGHHSFDLPDDPAVIFARDADALAQKIEEDIEDSAELPASVINRFVEKRRRAEASYVAAALGGLKETLFEVARGLSEGVAESERDELDVVGAMEDLSTALDSGSPENIQCCASHAITAMKDCLRKRQRRDASRLEHMGRRLLEMKARLAEAEVERTRDKLTGLPNRSALDERLTEDAMVAQLTGDPLTVMMLDIDHFKRFNDDHGHAAGDRVLATVGELLVERFPRKSDFAARYGGEEMCVVLSNAPLDRARVLAERFRHALEELVVTHAGRELRVTCSIGVAERKNREHVDTLLARADAALYAAKHGGRNRVCLADDTSTSAA